MSIFTADGPTAEEFAQEYRDNGWLADDEFFDDTVTIEAGERLALLDFDDEFDLHHLSLPIPLLRGPAGIDDEIPF